MKTTWLTSINLMLLINVCYINGWWLIPKCGPQKEGESCWAGCQCEDGLTCEAFVHKCRGPGKEGDSCHLTKPCGEGLTCEAGVHKCRRPGRSGDRCHATKPCGQGLSCQPGVHRYTV